MTTASGPMSQPPSLLRRVFLSPDEPRLRAGWRLLIHGLLTVLLTLLFSILILFVSSLLGQAPLRPPDPTAIGSPLTLAAPLVAITLATWIARRGLDRRSFIGLGFTIDEHTARDLVFGALMPGLLFALIFLVEWAAGWLTVEGTSFGLRSLGSVFGQLLLAVVLYAIVGYQEELLSRGYQLQNLVDGINLPIGLFISSAIFALLHAYNPGASILSTLGILVAGYFLALGWIRTGRLWLPIGLHFGWNFFQGTIFGFPVSGTGGFHLIQQSVHGPAAVTGGAFGPEAGLTGLMAMVLGAVLVWRYTRSRTGPFALVAPPPASSTSPAGAGDS